jgi:hypothetical protein
MTSCLRFDQFIPPSFTRALALAALVAGCTGEVTSPTGPNGTIADLPEGKSQFLCDPKQAAVAPSELRRLSRTQYTNSVRDFVKAALPKDGAVWGEIEVQLDSLPPDRVSKSAPFSSMDQAVSQQHVDTYFRIGELVGRALTSSPARLSALAPCSGSASVCIDQLIDRLGKRAFRRPLQSEERTFLREVYASDSIQAEAARDLVTVLLNAPQFVYMVEFGDDAVAGSSNSYELNDYELASRLSYHFWQTAPDDALLAAAERGELSDPTSYERVVDDMLADPRTQQSLTTFVKEWFGLDALRPLDSLATDPVFAAFAGEDMPSPALRDEMVGDVLDSFVYHVAQSDGLAAWLESPYSFARSEELAAIYKTPVWSGSGEPPRFPRSERAGLLTRAALLATGTANTRPIMKGVFIRERLLCDHLPPPPPNAANVPPELSDKQSTREVVTALTEAPKGNCASCHASLINPLGFATENYDALGRLRSEQPLFDEQGRRVGARPIDTSSIPRVDPKDKRPSDGVHDLLGYIVESGKVEACFARQYVRFARGRDDREELDGCALEQLRTSLDNGESLQEALRKFALRPEFRRRKI